MKRTSPSVPLPLFRQRFPSGISNEGRKGDNIESMGKRERPHLARLKKARMGGNKYMGMTNKFQLEYGGLLGKGNIRAKLLYSLI